MEKRPLTAFEYFRSILSIFVFFFLLIFIYTPVVLLLLILSLGRLTNFIMEKMVPPLGKFVLWIAGIKFRVKKHTEEIPETAIFIINHSSTLDILTILATGFPRIRFVAKWEFQYNPIFFLLGRLTGQVFIKRQDSEKAVETLRKSQKRIKRKRLSLLLAPEGSRKHPGIIGPFKKGPFRMAIDLGYPVVLVYFEGNRELSEGGLLLTRSGTCTAHIHPPIDTSDWKIETLEKHIKETRDRYLTWAGVKDVDVS
jgi:1-acyl-sn-glycerol-3-phosphate acyltransferase